MTEAAEKLLAEAMKLLPEERERLARQLLDSAGTANDDGDALGDLDSADLEAMHESIRQGLADAKAGRTVATADLIAEIRSEA